MDAWFVWSLIFLGLFGAGWLASLLAPVETVIKVERHGRVAEARTIRPRSSIRKGLLVPLGIAVFFLVMSCWVIVGTNQIGIFTSMSRPYTAEDNGFELKRPWAKKTEFDASKQFLRFCGDGNNEKDPDKKEYRRVSIKIDGNAKADICGVVTWQMKATTQPEKDQAVQLFKDYKVFERVTNNLVYGNLKVATGTALANLNPLVAEKNMSLAQINTKILTELQAQANGSIAILAADIAVPDYDEKTDEAIAADLAQKAKTSLEIEKKKTNDAAALANNAIVNSIQDPKVLINKCLDIARETGYNPGLCMMGASPIILPGDSLAKKPV